MSDLAIKPFAFYCPELQSLKLDGCDVSDEGMSAVAKNCKALPNPSPAPGPHAALEPGPLPSPEPSSFEPSP